MKRLMLIAVAALLAACTFDYNDDYNGPAYIVHAEPVETTYALDACYDEPYWHEPDWCDYYDDETCCVWYVDGWFEEWCQWDDGWCWEYNGSW